MPFGWVEAAASIYGAVQGSKSASNASHAANAAEGRASTIFNEQQGYEQQLQELMANPWKITQDPGYKFGMDQGVQAVTRTNAAGGYTGSGKMGMELMKYGQDYAHTFLGQQENLLASISGLTQNPNDYSRTGLAANQQSQSMMGDNLSSIANLVSRAGDASSGGLSGFGSAFWKGS